MRRAGGGFGGALNTTLFSVENEKEREKERDGSLWLLCTVRVKTAFADAAPPPRVFSFATHRFSLETRERLARGSFGEADSLSLHRRSRLCSGSFAFDGEGGSARLS